ncbi:MAG: hypothetical protein SFV15_19225 [Polyangiaceae bacterium]|nr:hypothetical protein [Polyangiaceae bacterium]
MELERKVGLTAHGKSVQLDDKNTRRSVLLKLAALGFEVPEQTGDEDLLVLARDLFARYREQTRLLSEHLCPADRRIQDFLNAQLAPLGPNEMVRLPAETLILDRYGLARHLSLPDGGDEWHNDVVSSYRLANGVMHNPTNDRRTTAGVFHVAEAGLPVPGDKLGVPLIAYARMLREAFNPPAELNRLPFTASWDEPVHTMASLMLRPLVCPAVDGFVPEKRLEVRFFVPGGCVSNLDFIESIFANAGDPHLPENDAGLDVDHWTGHTGCVVLAPHLTRLKKKELGLPHVSAASARQKASGMCWESEDELYNGGSAFKITLRSAEGVMVTILADNYFGYCKKEVKTQISFSANLYGLAEEEHAGGALAFATFSMGDRFLPDARLLSTDHRFSDVLELLKDGVELHDSGYATDVVYPEIHYLPEDMSIDLKQQDVSWTSKGEEQHLKLLPDHIYIHPSGYKIRMEKHPAAPSWRLIGTAPEGTFCHKPCTVSGGGKSEISKSLVDAVIFGPIYVGHYEQEMALVDEIFKKDYSQVFRTHGRRDGGSGERPLLSLDRSLGSVVKLLTPNDDVFTDEYNTWLRSIPNHVRAMVFIIKRFYRTDWGEDWRRHFSVDFINGAEGHELRYDGRKLVGSYLRVGVGKNGAWRTYKLRQDFVAADKVQMEDDISASIVVSASKLLGLPKEYDGHPSLKIVENCEWRLFQRPDDAIHPGVDQQAELDMSGEGLFVSNFQPLRPADVRKIAEDVSLHDAFTQPMRKHIVRSLKLKAPFSVCSAKPRLVGGKPTKNPRYLQVRPDVVKPRDRYVAHMGARLYRRIPLEKPVVFPVISVLSGRRNNPPEDGIRPLSVYSPIHYQELPELFMDYICSLTGKSPSTTGVGSEGALTKGPFNAISATADLNNALVSMLLTGYAGFSSAAGYIGTDYKMEHDVSLLIPEIWCRLFPHERDPKRMLEAGYLEPLLDYEFEGKPVLASRLGYRITSKFIRTFFGRVFDNPTAVFNDEILKPETQDPAVFADGMRNITEAQERVARTYFEDGSVKDACPPIAALLHIMAYGQWEGKDAHHPEVRAMFTREAMLNSEWYRARLLIKQQRDILLWERHVAYLSDFLALPSHRAEAERLGVPERLEQAKRELQRVRDKSYREELFGTIGADPVHGGVEKIEAIGRGDARASAQNMN